MSTRCQVEFYGSYDVPAKWTCSCEDFINRKQAEGAVCYHIEKEQLKLSPSAGFSKQVQSRSRANLTYTVTFTPGKQVTTLAARVYHHADGYPSNMIPALRYLESVVGERAGIFGERTNDPEWAAAEFVVQFRLRAEERLPKGEHSMKLPGGYRVHGNVYVTQHLHGDIAYLYKVYCYADGWVIDIYTAKYSKNHKRKFVCVSMKYDPKTGKALSE